MRFPVKVNVRPYGGSICVLLSIPCRRNTGLGPRASLCAVAAGTRMDVHVLVLKDSPLSVAHRDGEQTAQNIHS